MNRADKLLLVPTRLAGGKHSAAPRHSGTREEQRRLRQIRLGTLKDASVTEDARYAAHGLWRS